MIVLLFNGAASDDSVKIDVGVEVDIGVNVDIDFHCIFYF